MASGAPAIIAPGTTYDLEDNLVAIWLMIGFILILFNQRCHMFIGLRGFDIKT